MNIARKVQPTRSNTPGSSNPFQMVVGELSSILFIHFNKVPLALGKSSSIIRLLVYDGAERRSGHQVVR